MRTMCRVWKGHFMCPVIYVGQKKKLRFKDLKVKPFRVPAVKW